MEKEKIQAMLQEVKSAIKTLCFLYPRAAGYDEPKCAGVVLRRFQLRERDLIGFLEMKE